MASKHKTRSAGGGMDRSQAILEAALELFSEHGFAAVGVDGIGERAGVPGPHIYRHFSGKGELLATLIDQAMDRLLTLTAATADDPRDELAQLVRGHVRFALGDRALLSIYAQEARSLPEADSRRARRRQRAYVDRWTATLGRCYPSASAPELEAAAHGAIGHIQSVIRWPRALLEAPGLATMIERHVLGGLGTLADAAERGAAPPGER
ncbi:MAG: TetR/AcrR family transcriptional regulator [Solirubrobacteraceae bacterium]